MHARFGTIFPLLFLTVLAWPDALTAQAPDATTSPSSAPPSLDIPAGAKIDVALVRPLLSRAAVPGATIYAQTIFPVTAAGRVAIPPGTYVQGRLEKLIRPTRRKPRAELDVAFIQLVFANNYVAPLPDASAQAAAPHDAGTPIAIAVQVTSSNDVLLDNGAQIEITLPAPLLLDAKQVTAAIPVSRAPSPNEFKTASLCRPVAGTPGTPGTPDTVIPGSPGTPDTVIPGGPGMPDTVIPGTPATPDTVIPGTPGSPESPGISCPAPPIVLSSTLLHAGT